MERCGFKIIWILNSILLRNKNYTPLVNFFNSFMIDLFYKLKITYKVQFF